MRPTSVKLLAAIGAVAAAFGWAIIAVLSSVGGVLFPVPWAAAITVTIVALALFIWGGLLARRLRDPQLRRETNPFMVARTAALAMATSRTGAGVAGFYAGVAVATWLQGAGVISRAYSAAGSAAAAVTLAAVGVWLERVCRIDDSDSDEPVRRDDDNGEDWVLPSDTPH